MSDSLARVKRATASRFRAEQEWRTAIRVAIADGHSQRSVATAAGVTHTRVQQILRGQ